MLSTLNSVDLTSINNALQSYYTAVDNANANMNYINEAQQSLPSLISWTQVDLNNYIAQLSAPNLNAILATPGDNGGLSGVVLQMATIVDAANTFATTKLPVLNITTKVNAVSGTSSGRSTLAALYGKDTGANGIIWWMLNALYEAGSSSNSSLWIDPNGRISDDSNGNAYPGGDSCLTQACIENEIKYYNQHKVSDYSAINIPLSREQAQGAPYLIPLFAAILMAISSLCYKNHKWSSCLSSCTACYIFVVMIFMFLFMAFLFPLTLLTSDFCYGVENIGYEMITAKGDAFCSSSLNQWGTLTNCEICGPHSTGSGCSQLVSNNITFNLNIQSSYQSVLGSQCAALGDPLAATWAQVHDQLVTLPVTLANDHILDNADLRQNVSTIIKTAAQSSGQYFGALSDGFASALSCDQMASAYESAKNALCCKTSTAIYWAVASWYLIAFGMFLCGWPAAILGRKRFADTLWGPEAEPSLPPFQQEPVDVELMVYQQPPTMQHSGGAMQALGPAGISAHELEAMQAMQAQSIPSDGSLSLVDPHLRDASAPPPYADQPSPGIVVASAALFSPTAEGAFGPAAPLLRDEPGLHSPITSGEEISPQGGGVMSFRSNPLASPPPGAADVGTPRPSVFSGQSAEPPLVQKPRHSDPEHESAASAASAISAAGFAAEIPDVIMPLSAPAPPAPPEDEQSSAAAAPPAPFAINFDNVADEIRPDDPEQI
jgi:hypothetical protein